MNQDTYKKLKYIYFKAKRPNKKELYVLSDLPNSIPDTGVRSKPPLLILALSINNLYMPTQIKYLCKNLHSTYESHSEGINTQPHLDQSDRPSQIHATLEGGSADQPYDQPVIRDTRVISIIPLRGFIMLASYHNVHFSKN